MNRFKITTAAGLTAYLGLAGIAHAGDPLLQPGNLAAWPPTAAPTAPLTLTAQEQAASQVMSNVAAAAQGGDPAGAAMALGQQALRQWLPGLGADAPDWAKRIEFEWQMDRLDKPEYSILTVQPLYQSKNKQGTLFLQASQLRYAMFGDYRDTSNLGLGYRRLFLNDHLLAGLNAFYDREWTYEHQRTSVGGELKYANFDFGTNKYFALTDKKTIGATGMQEQALNGWDAELRSQLPYLQWATAGAKYYVWDKDQATQDTRGWNYGLQMDLTQNVQVELNWAKDNVNGVQTIAAVRFHLADNRPTMLSDRIVDSTPFEMRDMKEHTLDKVRRQNKVIVERSSSGGIKIGRGT